MIDRPIDLDARRTCAEKKEIAFRRKAANGAPSSGQEAGVTAMVIDAAMRAEPACNWIEAAAKAAFLLQLYSETPEARGDEKIRKLIARALGDFARLQRREENQE